MNKKIYKGRFTNKVMDNKLLIILLLAFIMLIPLTSANLGVVKKGSCVSIRVLANCSAVNFSEVTHGQTTEIINAKMTLLSGQTFNYTFCNTTDLGLYTYSWNNFCVDCSNDNCGNSFDVTQTGTMQTTSQGLGSLIFLVLVLSLTILFGYLGWRFLNSDTLWALGIFLVTMALILLVYNVWLLYEFKLNYTGATPDAGVAEIIFYIFMTVLTCGLMTAFIMLFTKWKVIKNKIKHAIKPEKEEKDDLI